ncbi:hypothetical protein FSBG_01724 [Fusobacterium gonidiaformans 3-1-5R]|uniref:Uncharacterized protein n=1 Tax=Fusobacterium gonidiaformans 3-1-5R TaxID=469605 RepID=E5BIA4_9FUSO|nr:DUF1846 domain-containing protein [Fusobacterium gonidiaformans]EFS22227.1 hypothetical protein FSBG_01724 [Fusobacterium gonidiaformans 3-1-5R]
MKIGFDHNKYLEEQSKFIAERVNHYDKLYLEFGGKLMFDLHAKRVLPGFDENAKIKVLSKLKDKVEVVICVYAGDIERNKMRGDFGITYDMEVFRLIDDLREHDLKVNSVVITRYEERPATALFITKLERRGIKVYKHLATKGYPTDIDTIVSDEGYGKNPYIETERPIVVVTAPGPGSGKLATCLGQLYHEFKRGKSAGYSKFETFPVWNVPLKHPLNIAYEAATIDLADVNMIDPFHLEAYGETTVNYNRDIEAFPLLKRIIEKITGEESIYKSPTDMGVNRVGFGIIDDAVVQEASKQEIIRRYFNAGCEYKKGYIDYPIFQRAELIMRNLNLTEEDRKCVAAARNKAKTSGILSAVALELQDGSIITGRQSELMDATSAAILNAVKHLADFDDKLLLLSPVILEPILTLKEKTLNHKNVPLDCEEILIALSISAATNPMAASALSKLQELKGVQAHCTHILAKKDEQTLKKLGIDITCDQVFPTENLYYNS